MTDAPGDGWATGDAYEAYMGRWSRPLAGAEALPRRAGGFDAVVSGLVLNFLQDPGGAVASIRERLHPGGTVAAYVWDYREGMQFLRSFREEAVASDALDEGRRFPLCRTPALASLFRAAGLVQVETDRLGIPTAFARFAYSWMGWG